MLSNFKIFKKLFTINFIPVVLMLVEAGVVVVVVETVDCSVKLEKSMLRPVYIGSCKCGH